MLVLTCVLVQSCSPAPLPGTTPGPGDGWGAAVATAAGTTISGAPYDDFQGTDAGTVWVHTLAPKGWLESDELHASDATANALFGFALDLDERQFAVGAPGDRGVGAVYVFEWSGGAWTESAKITAGDGEIGDEFGSAVAIDDDTLLVGAPGRGDRAGRALVFRKDPNGWTRSDDLTMLTPPSAGDELGAAVAVAGELALVGAPGADAGGPDSGVAHLYVEPSGAGPWTLAPTWAPIPAVAGEAFGSAVALSSTFAIVGAPEADDAGADSGAAVVYRAGPQWSEMERIVPLDAQPGDAFGSAVALHGDHIVVGAPRADPLGEQSGATYTFRRFPPGGPVWQELGKHVAVGGQAGDWFGSSVGIGDGSTIAGAPFASEGAPFSGSVWAVECPSMMATPSELSLAAGGTQTWFLDAGPEHAGEVYLVLGSAAGTSPGFVSGDQVIPVNTDAYFLASLQFPNAPPFQSSLGVLNPQGAGTARFVLPPGSSPSLAGVELHHAFAVVGVTPTLLSITFASNPTSVVLAP